MPNSRDDELPRHIASLRRYAIALAGNRSEADDLVQDALQRALVFLRGGGNIDNLRPYLFSILHNVRADRLKRERGRKLDFALDDEGLGVGAAPPQDTQIECRQVVERVQQLPEDQRRVILLVAMEGLTYREVAEVLKVPLGTVMSRLSRGRIKLQQSLERYGCGGGPGAEEPVQLQPAE